MNEKTTDAGEVQAPQLGLLRVLILDDNAHGLASTLRDTFKKYNDGELYTLPPHVASMSRVRFDVTLKENTEDFVTCLAGTPSWDAYVIDNRFGTVAKAISINRPLNDLQAPGLRIVWTGHPDPEVTPTMPRPPKHQHIVECMRLGAWDYIIKGEPRYGDTCIDVIVSILEGLAEREKNAIRAQVDREGHEFVVQHYGEIYREHRGHFVAFAREGGQWQIKQKAKSPSLYDLYQQIDPAMRDQLHITFIAE